MAVISSFSDENVETAPYLTSWVSCIRKIMFNFFDLGRPRIAHAVWRDYGAKMDAVVYIVDATRANEQFLGPRRDVNDLLSDEAFANLPFLILCTTQSFDYPEEALCSLLDLTNATTGKGLTLELAKANAHPLELVEFGETTTVPRHLPMAADPPCFEGCVEKWATIA
nr:gtp-binding protein sar2 [Quercus suber]